MKFTRNALILAAVATGCVAQATTWTFDYNPTLAEQNPNGGRIKNIKTTFNDVTNRMTFQVNLGATASGGKTDGFWLAVNDGPNPKGHAGELGLLYFDAFGPGGPVLTAYNYNGLNGDTSFKDGSPAPGDQAPDKIASSLTTGGFVNSLIFTNHANGTRTLGFDIDASVINNHSPLYPGNSPWHGIGFDNKIGMWFHTVNNLDATYGSDGFLKNWSHTEQGWFDSTNQSAVPEPATLIVFGGAALMGLRKKFKKS